MKVHPPKDSAPQRLGAVTGISLLEVLVALLITGMGLLGLAALQVKAQQADMESSQRSEALILLQDMASRLRANPAEKMRYLTPGGTCAGHGAATSMAGQDLFDWGQRISDTLPAGCGCIAGDDSLLIVSLVWQGLFALERPGDLACGADRIPDQRTRRTLSMPVAFFTPKPSL